MTDADSLGSQFFDAHSTGADAVPPSSVDADFDLDAAYAVQHAYVQARLATDTIAGFKAGATAAAAQKLFGLSGPFTGVLFASGEQADQSTLPLSSFSSLLLETEVGFRVERSMSDPVDLGTLKRCISHWQPVVELADTGFYGSAKSTGADLIAANSGSAGFLIGTAGKGGANVNDIEVAFTRDGEALHQGRAGDVLGDQWQALLWLVNSVIEQGYVVEEGHLLMTGAIGAPHPGEPGSYLADYGDFGKASFELT